MRAALYEDAVARGGVISGEHGIGLVKREYLSRTTDPTALALMRAVKRAVDPEGILNPGKILEGDARQGARERAKARGLRGLGLPGASVAGTLIARSTRREPRRTARASDPSG